jgi:hypothetical protein
MQRRFLQIIALALWMNLAAQGQSLGDIARANREKQTSANAPTNPSAVITTDDLQGGDEPRSAGAVAGNASNNLPKNKAAHNTSGQQLPVDERAAAQWKKQILAQKDKLATLQARIDQLNALIHPAGSAQFEGPYNRYQTTQMERLAAVQLQFNEQKTKLTEMQEEARRSGMHTTVYDP